MTVTRQHIFNVANQIRQRKAQARALVGFDGFVDEILHAVAERSGAEAYTRMDQMTQLSDRIHQAAGKSCNLELVPQVRKLGGNGPILAHGLGCLGLNVNYLGALGNETIVDVFEPLQDRCENVFSLESPGHTQALEFNDGKVMLGRMEHLKGVNAQRLRERVSQERLSGLLEKTDLLATVNWTMLPYFEELLDEVVDTIPEVAQPPLLFVDLADPGKRPQPAVRHVMERLSNLQQTLDVVLGLNENETRLVLEAMGETVPETLSERVEHLRALQRFYAVVGHTAQRATVATEGRQTAYVEAPHTPQPRLATGAGDTFNSGFCAGIMTDLTPADALLSGVCAAGFYVRYTRAPAWSELADFMEAWADDRIEEPA